MTYRYIAERLITPLITCVSGFGRLLRASADQLLERFAGVVAISGNFRLDTSWTVSMRYSGRLGLELKSRVFSREHLKSGYAANTKGPAHRGYFYLSLQTLDVDFMAHNSVAMC